MKRIQRKRTKGWRMPENAVYVGRPSRWGNPYKVDGKANGVENAAHATRLYRQMLENGGRAIANGRSTRLPPAKVIVAELRGKDLACWCKLDSPCHADVLIELCEVVE